MPFNFKVGKDIFPIVNDQVLLVNLDSTTNNSKNEIKMEKVIIEKDKLGWMQSIYCLNEDIFTFIYKKLKNIYISYSDKF